MPQESKPLMFFPMVLGNTINVHKEVLQRLMQRLQLKEAYAVDNCDVIFAFVPIVSRAGTDIEAGLQNIPTSDKPIVLMGLHFTFDENYIAPQSKWSINRSNVHAVDLNCSEDRGLLRSLRNDEALKVVTDYLMSIGGSPNTQQETTAGSQNQCSYFGFLVFFIFVIALALIICLIIYSQKWPENIVPTLQPNTTANVTHLNNGN